MGDQHLLRVCAAGLGIVILAGCGGSSSKTTSNASGSRTPLATSPATSRSATPATFAQLEKIVLGTADFPTAWTGTAHQANASDAAWQASFVTCLAVRDTYGDKASEAFSQDFALGDAVVVSNAISYRSQSDVDTDVAALRGPKFAPCIDQLMKNQTAQSQPPGTPIVASFKITPGSGGGPANVVGTGTGTIKTGVNGQQVVRYLSFTYITGPLLEAEVDTSNVGAPLPAAEVRSLVAAVATRAAKR
jgi:hypothetical protein